MNKIDRLEKIWMSMLGRCARTGHLKSEVCPEWKQFDKFCEWAKDKYFQGAALDKDILGKGGRLYSPDTTAFVTNSLNFWFKDGRWLQGRLVKPVKVGGYKRFKAVVCGVDLGTYLTEKYARKVSREYLADLLKEKAEAEPDARVRDVLCNFKFKV